MNVTKWLDDLLAADKKFPMPILSFPSVSLLNISVKELISSSDMQAKGMKLVADHNPSAAAVSMMDLSVEAEAFGSEIRFSENEVPTVMGAIADTMEKAESLAVPKIGVARTGLYIDSIKKAKELITDRPVFAGIIGPFSLAGRLIDVNEAFIKCYEEPELVHTVLKKVTEFLTNYAKAYKAAGADGIVMAEPLAGLLSPDLAEEFSEPYVKAVFDALKADDFAVIYHNCGDSTIYQIDSILRTNASAYHFGNAVNMAEMMSHIPSNVIAMGNVDPISQFKDGTPQSIKTETKRILTECANYKNFVISSGCDIPPMVSWENIDAFYEAVDEFYTEK